MTDWNPDFMNIEEAFEYARVNADVLAKKGEKGEIVAGVAFFPGDSNGEFQLFELTYQYPESEDEYAFLAYFQGGSLFSSSTTEESYSGDTFEEVLAEMPDIAEGLNYQCFNAEQTLAGMTTEGWLCEIYPQLPDPEMIDTDRSVFKMTAISLISELGNSFQHNAPSTKN